MTLTLTLTLTLSRCNAKTLHELRRRQVLSPYISHISPLYLTSSEMGIMREMRRTKRIGKTITYLARGDIAEMQG